MKVLWIKYKSEINENGEGEALVYSKKPEGFSVLVFVPDKRLITLLREIFSQKFLNQVPRVVALRKNLRRS